LIIIRRINIFNFENYLFLIDYTINIAIISGDVFILGMPKKTTFIQKIIFELDKILDSVFSNKYMRVLVGMIIRELNLGLITRKLEGLM